MFYLVSRMIRFHGGCGSFRVVVLALPHHLPQLHRVKLLGIAFGPVVPGHWVGHPCTLPGLHRSFLHRSLDNPPLRRSRVSSPARINLIIVFIYSFIFLNSGNEPGSSGGDLLADEGRDSFNVGERTSHFSVFFLFFIFLILIREPLVWCL